MRKFSYDSYFNTHGFEVDAFSHGSLVSESSRKLYDVRELQESEDPENVEPVAPSRGFFLPSLYGELLDSSMVEASDERNARFKASQSRYLQALQLLGETAMQRLGDPNDFAIRSELQRTAAKLAQSSPRDD